MNDGTKLFLAAVVAWIVFGKKKTAPAAPTGATRSLSFTEVQLISAQRVSRGEPPLDFTVPWQMDAAGNVFGGTLD